METVATIRERVERLQAALREVAEAVPREALHWKPAPDAWSVAQIVAHAAEFQAFFSGDVLRLKSEPGSRFGRTMDHPQRLEAVNLSGEETWETLLGRLEEGNRRTLSMLGELTDQDLRIEGVHPKFGQKSIAWEIEHFITEHLEKHIGQVQRTYQAYREAGTEERGQR